MTRIPPTFDAVDPTKCIRCGAACDPFLPACQACAPLVRQERQAEAERWRAELRAGESDRRRRRLEAALALVPEEHQGLRFESPDLAGRVRRAEAIDEAHAAIGRPMVLLAGKAGAGKTSLAAAIYHAVCDGALAGDRAMVELGWSARWFSALSLSRARREHRLGDGEAREVRQAIEASVLVLDGLGEEREDRDGAISDIVHERHGKRAPTVVTTGEPYAGLVKRYGDGIARRLAERGRATIILCAAKVPEGQTELALAGGG